MLKDTTFYLPVYYDFRGRIYTYSYYLSYQSKDIYRALIDFKHEATITEDNVYYLKLYLADTSNKKFKSINKKIEWVDELIGNFRDNPLTDQQILEMSEPYQFYKIYHTLYKYYIENINKTKIPILLDASCSGLQHLSALGSIPGLAESVNVINNTDIINDIYNECAVEMNKWFKENNYDIIFNRSHIKKSIMTTSYNISDIGVKLQ
jgi:DNA-directed RNA polymerase